MKTHYKELPPALNLIFHKQNNSQKGIIEL